MLTATFNSAIGIPARSASHIFLPRRYSTMASKRSGGVPLEGDQPTTKRQTLRRLSTDNLSWPESTRPELRVSRSDPNRCTTRKSNTPSNQCPAVGDSIDVVSKTARSMKVGEDLLSLCVAVGPADAARIRHDYLLDIEEYLVHSLDVLNSSLTAYGCSRRYGRTHRYSSLHLSDFPKNLFYFDKCRDNVKAWMAVNTNWRSRITLSKVVHYRLKRIGRSSFKSYLWPQTKMEADMIFNNPALAIELGLEDIVCYLSETVHINLRDTIWGAFVVPMYTLPHPALVRGNFSLLRSLLSCTSNRLRSAEGQVFLKRLLLRAVRDDCIGAEAFSTFVHLPTVPVSYTHSDGDIGIPTLSTHMLDSPLARALVRLAAATSVGMGFSSPNNRAETDNVQLHFYEDSIKDLRAKKVLALVDAGADSDQYSPNLGGTPLDFARKRLSHSSDCPLWKEVVDTMEIGFLL